MSKYRFLDHTADIAIEIFGKSLNELFSNAAEAFSKAFVNTEKISPGLKRKIELKSNNIEELMYDWLDEFLFIFDTEFEVPLKVEKINISENGGLELTAEIYFGKVTPEMVSAAPKGISLHKFKVEREKDGYRAFVIIDI